LTDTCLTARATIGRPRMIPTTNPMRILAFKPLPSSPTFPRKPLGIRRILGPLALGRLDLGPRTRVHSGMLTLGMLTVPIG
jgi:hypothetical protein